MCSGRFFYASSACIYPENAQLTTEMDAGLKESCAWPAEPQDAYGLEKLASEELAKHYQSDFGMQTRCARFHNIYGPFGTWKGAPRLRVCCSQRGAVTGSERAGSVRGKIGHRPASHVHRRLVWRRRSRDDAGAAVRWSRADVSGYGGGGERWADGGCGGGPHRRAREGAGCVLPQGADGDDGV